MFDKIDYGNTTWNTNQVHFRDLCAMAAMAAWMPNYMTDGNPPQLIGDDDKEVTSFEGFAKMAFDLADAMEAERLKRPIPVSTAS